MPHDHGHDHAHDHGPANYNRAFAFGVALNLGFVAVEAVYGTLADSLALIADAGHNFSDVVSLLLAWGASLVAASKSTARRTYGLRRATVLASLLSGILLLVAVGGIAWEALGRIGSPEPVEGMTIIAVAGVGVVINTITALMFVSGRKHDLNIRGAYLHMAADAAISLGVVIAGLGIVATGWLWLDPAVSLVLSAVIAVGTWGLLRDSVDLAVDAVPGSIDPEQVRDYLLGLPGVSGLHDLHIWGMSTTEAALTVHLEIPEAMVDDRFLHDLAHALEHEFGIEHPTVQIERGLSEELCELALPDSV